MRLNDLDELAQRYKDQYAVVEAKDVSGQSVVPAFQELNRLRLEFPRGFNILHIYPKQTYIEELQAKW